MSKRKTEIQNKNGSVKALMILGGIFLTLFGGFLGGPIIVLAGIILLIVGLVSN